MGERASYAPGTFCWADLTTTDEDAAKGFYGELFGWVAEDMPVDEGVVYSMMRLEGRDVAAISPQQAQQREAGARSTPTFWGGRSSRSRTPRCPTSRSPTARPATAACAR